MPSKFRTKEKFGMGKINRRQQLRFASRMRWMNLNKPEIAVSEAIPGPSTSNVLSNNESVQSEITTAPAVAQGMSNIQNNSPIKLSASEKKIVMFGKTEANTLSDMNLENPIEYEDLNIIINFKQLSNFMNKFCCPFCKKKSLVLKLLPDKRNGIVNYIYTQCSNCGEEEEACATSARLPGKGSKGKTDFLLNTRIVSSFVSNGQSYAAFDHFCGAMNMHSMSHKSFDHHASAFQKAAVVESGAICNESVVHIRQAYKELNPLALGDILDICVSFDGSWRKRGHTSNHGIGVVIDVVTGLVIDYEILSIYCPTCDALVKRKNITPANKDIILQKHQDSGKCQKNFDGSSNAMESEAAKRIWSRSLNKFNLRYTEMLSDGDAKTHSSLLALDPYPGVVIVKDECINHIQKRMGTALRNLVAEEKAKGVQLGGRGKLSATVIDRLAMYYGKAIRDNTGDLEGMRAAVFATVFHVISTDEKHYHQRCPPGVDSWCFYNRAIAKGDDPGPHKENMSTIIPKAIADKMMDVYKRLGDPNLLLRCMKGKTQNVNESLHAKIWSYSPKVAFSGRRLLDLAVAHAISEFNVGAHVLSNTLGILNIEAGKLTVAHSEKRNKQRISQSKRRATQNTKAQRLARKRKQLHQQEVLDRQEGHLYAAGDGD